MSIKRTDARIASLTAEDREGGGTRLKIVFDGGTHHIPMTIDIEPRMIGTLSFADSDWGTHDGHDGRDPAPVKAFTLEVTGLVRVNDGLPYTMGPMVKVDQCGNQV